MGDLAANVLSGVDPATVPVLNVVPAKLAVNTTALAGLRDAWTLPPELVARAQLVVDETGTHDKTRKDSLTRRETDQAIDHGNHFATSR